jgi:hypothetical protein
MYIRREIELHKMDGKVRLESVIMVGFDFAILDPFPHRTLQRPI